MRNLAMLATTVLAASLALWGCSDKTATGAGKQDVSPASTASVPDPAAAAAAPPAGSRYTGTVVETVDSGGYTYVQVDTGAKKLWAAAPQFTVAVGDEVTFPATLPMPNYHSKTLDRTFDVVYFAGAITPAGAASARSSQLPSGHPGGPIASASAQVDFAGIEKAKGGNTVGELLADMTGFSGKEVSVRGKVVKFNAGIMGKNWIHVQDGTGEPGSNDLTVTTEAVAEVGDTVLVRGVAAADRDFGYGYKYAFILEDAEVTVE